jgi:DNA-binding transcriptional LysR family regulator
VELTDAGRAFLEEARATLMHLDRAFDSTRRASRGEQGRLCVGVTSTTPFHPVVPRAIRAFREACPMVALTLEECLSNESVDRVRNEQMDVAFIHMLARTRAETPLSFDQLSGETFILYGPPGTGMYDTTIAACQAAGFSPRIGNLGASTQLAPRITSTLSLVGAGLGITFVPSSLQRMNMEGVAYRAIKASRRPMVTLKLASRRDEKSAIVKQFINFVKKEAKGYA